MWLRRSGDCPQQSKLLIYTIICKIYNVTHSFKRTRTATAACWAWLQLVCAHLHKHVIGSETVLKVASPTASHQLTLLPCSDETRWDFSTELKTKKMMCCVEALLFLFLLTTSFLSIKDLLPVSSLSTVAGKPILSPLARTQLRQDVSRQDTD